MVKAMKAGIALPFFCFTLGVCNAVMGQDNIKTAVRTEVDKDSLQHMIVRATVKKITGSHYSPKPLDNAFSARIFDAWLKALDPYRNIFLQEDVKKLSGFRHAIDEQLKEGSTAFFDSAYNLLRSRQKETASYIDRVLATPFDLTHKDSLAADRKNSPFPASQKEKQQLWKQYLRHYVLTNYAMPGEMQPATIKVDTAVEREARQKVAAWYKRYFKENKDAWFSSYINTIVMEMDPHTTYTGPQDADKLAQALSGKYVGLGMELAVQGADVYIKKLTPGGSAVRSGLIKENDRIVAVSNKAGNMVPTTEMAAEDIASLIRGEKGTNVSLTLRQPGEPERTVTVMRDEIQEAANKAKSAVILYNGKRLGYIHLPIFYQNSANPSFPGCSNDVALEIEKLKDEQVEGIIFDLRGNPGGSLQEVVWMGASFMPEGPMALLRSKDSIQVYRSPAVKTPQYEGPLVVLVDEGSASASEIFAGVVQDRKRGLVLGTASSFGKGTAQVPVTIGKMGDPDKGTPDISFGSFRLTTQKFYRVSGASTQLRGVIPDIVLVNGTGVQHPLEKDYASALAWDTLAISDYVPSKPNFNYSVVTTLAQQRIRNNATLQEVQQSLDRLKQMQQEAHPLDLRSFYIKQKEKSRYEKKLQQLKSAEIQVPYTVEPAILKRVSPSQRQQMHGDADAYASWLQTLKRDLFIAEAGAVVQDMIANPE